MDAITLVTNDHLSRGMGLASQGPRNKIKIFNKLLEENDGRNPGVNP
jgi:hypothetical protein